MPLYRASFRHTFSSGGTVELTSKPYPANSWAHAQELADAFGYEAVRIAVADHYQHGGRREYPMLTAVDADVPATSPADEERGSGTAKKS